VRYYEIVLTNASTGASIKTYTSFVNNQTIPGALDIEIDVPVTAFAQPTGEGYVRIWGVSLEEISQASDLNGAAVKVFAGMQAGLPLANPKQAGLIAQGYILQAFGNWIGTEQSLELILTASPTKAAPVNLVLDWKKGTTLESALKNTLSTAYPGYTLDFKISSNLVAPSDQKAPYANLTQLAQYIKQYTSPILGSDYRGVDIFLTEKTFSVFDGTTASDPKQIAFNDLIGQPTWIEPSTVQAKVVMRSKISVGDFIKFPNAQVTSSAISGANLINQKLTFQGAFLVDQIRHVGHFRQADAASWVTVINAASIQPVSSQ
jgi:hypothetical protein